MAMPSLDDNGQKSTLSPHLGRCPFFVLAGLNGTAIESIWTIIDPYASSHETGRDPNLAADRAVDAISTGGIGLRAIAAFPSLGVRAVTARRGTARRVLNDHVRRSLGDASPCSRSRGHDAPGASGRNHRRRLEHTAGKPGRSGAPR